MKYIVTFSLGASSDVHCLNLTTNSILEATAQGLVAHSTTNSDSSPIAVWNDSSNCWCASSVEIQSSQGDTVTKDASLNLGETYLIGQFRFRIDDLPNIPSQNNRPSQQVRLSNDRVTFGVSPNVDVRLDPDAGIDEIHFEIVNSTDGTKYVRKISESKPIRINGDPALEYSLVYGDVIGAGRYRFEYRVNYLVQIDSAIGCTLDADGLSVVVGNGIQILDDAGMQVSPHEFIGVLGGSGQGKSTLMNCLSGANPPTTGEVHLDTIDVPQLIQNEPGSVGMVPQDDIVHTELTVRDALYFSVRLRISSDISEFEIHRLINRILDDLRLTPHQKKAVADLSGGQRKRVSIATEMISRPRILFLDEPTSGLDPATEQGVMELLRHRATKNCPVVCTTHILGGAFLFNEVVFINQGRIVFRGAAGDAPKHFKTKSITDVYALLEQEAKDKVTREVYPETRVRSLPKAPEARIENSGDRPSFFTSVKTLIQRQKKILFSVKANINLLLVQAILLGVLVGAGVENVTQRAFLLILASLWFGCSNASQSIVKELPVLQRERLAGLNTNAYLISKFWFWGGITILQVLIYWCVIQTTVLLVHGQPGSYSQFHAELLRQNSEMPNLVARSMAGLSQFLGIAFETDSFREGSLAEVFTSIFLLKVGVVLASCLVGVGLGIAISSFVKSIVPAVLLVPIVILPQIPLSGSMISIPEMSDWFRRLSAISPCYQLKRISDGAEIYGMERPKILNFSDSPVYVESVGGEADSSEDEDIHAKNNAWQNHVTDPTPRENHKKIPLRIQFENIPSEDLNAELADKGIYAVFADNRNDVRLQKGQYFLPESYGSFYSFGRSFLWLLLWFVGSYVFSYTMVRKNTQ